MTKHLLRDLDYLKQEILTMGGLVEGAINKAISALINRDAHSARQVMDGEEKINQKELVIGEECLKVLALHQPVASDLRFIVAVMQVNNDLERMGDLAENIAERAITLSEHEGFHLPFDLSEVAGTVRAMVGKSLDALVNQDAGLARSVCEMDDEVDAAHREFYKLAQDAAREDPSRVESATMLISASRNLERIADHATNIAEDVVFMVEGEVIRHKGGDLKNASATSPSD